MNNRSENVKKINKYIIISIVVFTFLVIVMFYRLTYLGSINNISATYDYYTGVLPAVLIGFAGIDIIFYLIYLRDKLSYNSVRHNLAMWIYILFIFSFFAFILPLFTSSIDTNRPQIIPQSMLMINLITIGIPAILSISIPVYLLVTSHRFQVHI